MSQDDIYTYCDFFQKKLEKKSKDMCDISDGFFGVVLKISDTEIDFKRIVESAKKHSSISYVNTTTLKKRDYIKEENLEQKNSA